MSRKPARSPCLLAGVTVPSTRTHAVQRFEGVKLLGAPKHGPQRGDCHRSRAGACLKRHCGRARDVRFVVQPNDDDVSRAVLYSVGEAGTPSQNPGLKQLIGRSSKQSAAFNRSVVANVSLQQAQLEANPDMNPHQTLTTKTKNLTRWLGLWEMANRNRRVGPEIRIALTGNASGVCAEAPAMPAIRPMLEAGSDSEEEEDDLSDGEDQEEGNHAANKKYPLAHRCISTVDFRSNEILESVLDRPRETTLLSQEGEGLDLGMGFVLLGTMRDEAKADRVEVSMHTPLSYMHAPISCYLTPISCYLTRSLVL